MKPIQILIADDHTMVREGVRKLIEIQPDMEIVGEATDGIEALNLVRSQKPDLLLLDINMPKMSGFEVVGLALDAAPDLAIVILSMYETEGYAHKIFQAGAKGYVLKAAPSQHLLAAIRRVNEGEYYLSPKMRSSVMTSYLGGCRQEEPARGGYEELSDREKQVFQLLVQGNATTEIATILFISSKTVEKHRANIIKKIGISQPVQMVKYAIRIGVLDLETWRG